ncbi:hypothetical protein NPIL_594571 [Nephila pilipes]|uniref:Uncharacterized protein n=1 Tax=Nephila pilipes TaxID=299642 RepID=A0A8X6IAT3_NEPPI|nr:hypothetical protein NPIL_594571 [Nephila pilipes]
MVLLVHLTCCVFQLISVPSQKERSRKIQAQGTDKSYPRLMSANQQAVLGPRSKKYWNFKKVNWGNFEKMTDRELGGEREEGKLDPSQSSENLVYNLRKTIQFCVKACVTRGNVKCFWSPELEKHKKKRDRPRGNLSSQKAI